MRRTLAVLAVALAGVLTVGGTVGGAVDPTDGSPGQAGSGGDGTNGGRPGEPGRPGESGGGARGGSDGSDGADGGGNGGGGGNNGGGGGNNGGGGGGGDNDRDDEDNPRGGGDNPRGGGDNPRGGGDNPRGGGDNPRGGGEEDDDDDNDGPGEERPNQVRSLSIDDDAVLGEDRHTVTLTVQFVCPSDGRFAAVAKARQGRAVSSGAAPVQCAEGESRTLTVETTDPNRRFEAGAADACVAIGRAGSGAIPNPVCSAVTLSEAAAEAA